MGERTFISIDKEVTEIVENNIKYFIQISDTVDYYIDKNDTINYDTVNYEGWKVYQIVRQDILCDTFYGGYYLGNGKDYYKMNLICNYN